MPKSGSQVVLCDTPIRFDTYEGCSHACTYCFVKRKNTLAVGNGESVDALRAFIEGKRSNDIGWCDWNIPIHWGGMSDPFQPVEKERKRSLECLKLLAETQYPFVVSTKSDLFVQEPYLSLLKECNCVIQISAVSPRFDGYERGAATFHKRVEAAAKITPYKRVVARVQPYLPSLLSEVKNSIRDFHDAGIYGATFEGMKYLVKKPGTIKLAGDFVFPLDVLKPQFSQLKELLHSYGMKFYSAENRLRYMGDDLCCCGIEGMGWELNTCNFNHYLYDRDHFKAHPAQQKPGSAKAFNATHQNPAYSQWAKKHSFEEAIMLEVKSSAIKQMIGEK